MPILKASGMTFERLCDFFHAFQAPKDQKANLKGAIVSFEKPKGKEWKPSASEVLHVSAVAARSVGLPTGSSRAQAGWTSFLLLCKILDLLSLISKDLEVNHDQLNQAIQGHLNAFRNAHGEDNLVPKFHYSMHLPMLLRAHGLLISCWCHERKHKSLRRWAASSTTTAHGLKHLCFRR